MAAAKFRVGDRVVISGSSDDFSNYGVIKKVIPKGESYQYKVLFDTAKRPRLMEEKQLAKTSRQKPRQLFSVHDRVKLTKATGVKPHLPRGHRGTVKQVGASDLGPYYYLIQFDGHERPCLVSQKILEKSS